MVMLWSIIKRSATDVWDEILYLIIFNIIWLIGAALIIPLPFVTFGLFFTVYDISQGRGIKLTTFFGHARQVWKPAYLWGGINLGVLLVSWSNLVFYGQMEARWASVVQMIVVALTVFWFILQLLTLGLYPRLVEPGFKLALRNAAVMVGMQPLAVLLLLFVTLLVGLLILFFPATAFVGAFSILAVVTNRTTQVILARAEVQQKVGSEETRLDE